MCVDISLQLSYYSSLYLFPDLVRRDGFVSLSLLEECLGLTCTKAL